MGNNTYFLNARECTMSPANLSIPGMDGVCGALFIPVATTTLSKVSVSLPSISSTHLLFSASRLILVTLVLSLRCGRK